MKLLVFMKGVFLFIKNLFQAKVMQYTLGIFKIMCTVYLTVGSTGHKFCAQVQQINNFHDY